MWYNTDVKKLKLTNGGITKVDDDDFDFLSKWNWQNSGGYVRRTEYSHNLRISNTKHRSINRVYSMHRVVNNTPEGMSTDHINGDKLDNRKCNLRTVTKSQNSINKALRNKGVQYRKDRKRSPFRVYVSHDTKELYIACFQTFGEAEQAYYTVSEQLNGGIRCQ